MVLLCVPFTQDLREFAAVSLSCPQPDRVVPGSAIARRCSRGMSLGSLMRRFAPLCVLMLAVACGGETTPGDSIPDPCDGQEVGASCNDANPCTENGQCTDTGACVGTPVT